MASQFGEYGTVLNQISSALASVVLGFISWHLIEKRSMAVGSKLVNRLNGKIISAPEPARTY
jgi:peptidoglycan/LPS O-acetylase OafA/YrhL